MLNKLIQNLHNLDKVTYNLIKKGVVFSFTITIIATIILFFNMQFIENITLYYAGLSIFKSSIFFSVFFIICGISMDTIKKQEN